MKCRSQSICLVILLLIVSLSFSVFAADVESNVPSAFNSMDDLLNYFNGTTNVYSGGQSGSAYRSIYLFPPYAKESTAGFSSPLRGPDGRTYKIRVRSARLVANNCCDVTDVKFVVSVADGQEKTLSHAVQTCASTEISISMGISIPLGNLLPIINFQCTYKNTFTQCQTITQGTAWKFPNYCKDKGYNSASYYIGMARDKYEIVVDAVPYERDTEGYRDCLDNCDPMYPSPEQYQNDRMPPGKNCTMICNRLFPLQLKMNEMVSETGYILLPVPIEWSVCTNVVP